MNRHLKHDILRLFALTVGLLLMVILLSGCRPTQIITDNNTEIHDSVFNEHKVALVDTVYINERIVEKTKGDTVFLTTEKFKYVYKLKHDTLRLVEYRDSIQYKLITQTVTEYKTPWWCRGGLLLLLLALVAFLLLLVVKR